MDADAESRLYPQRPFVGVGVVVWRKNEFLLIRRGKEPRRGEWSLPGGLQEVGETVFEAATREIHEETNLAIEKIAMVDIVDAINRDDSDNIRTHYTLIDLVAEAPTGDPTAGSDADDVGWFVLADLAALDLWPETARIIKKSDEIRRSRGSRNH